MNRKYIGLSAAAMAAMFVAGHCLAGDGAGFKIIVNPARKTAAITKQFVDQVYLGREGHWISDDKSIAAAMVQAANPSMTAFIEQVLEKTAVQFDSYWKKRIFSGAGGQPRSFATSAEVVDYVARNPDAIGVVEAGAMLTGVEEVVFDTK